MFADSVSWVFGLASSANWTFMLTLNAINELFRVYKISGAGIQSDVYVR